MSTVALRTNHTCSDGESGWFSHTRWHLHQQIQLTLFLEAYQSGQPLIVILLLDLPLTADDNSFLKREGSSAIVS